MVHLEDRKYFFMYRLSEISVREDRKVKFSTISIFWFCQNFFIRIYISQYKTYIEEDINFSDFKH